MVSDTGGPRKERNAGECRRPRGTTLIGAVRLPQLRLSRRCVPRNDRVRADASARAGGQKSPAYPLFQHAIIPFPHPGTGSDGGNRAKQSQFASAEIGANWCLERELARTPVGRAAAKTKPIWCRRPVTPPRRASVSARLDVSCGDARPTKRRSACKESRPGAGKRLTASLQTGTIAPNRANSSAAGVQNKANLGWGQIVLTGSRKRGYGERVRIGRVRKQSQFGPKAHRSGRSGKCLSLRAPAVS